MSIQQNFPSTRPSLNLNFARSKTLDPRITFTRTSSATYVDENGLVKIAPANSPRFDHDPVTGECLGLLIEESRTNLLTGSDYATNNSLLNVTLTLNAGIAPDGTNTAVSMDGENSNNNIKYMYKGRSTNTTGTYTTSVFMKYKNERYVVLRMNDNTGVNGVLQRIDILNGVFTNNVETGGTLTNASSSIIPYPNGWYRITVSGTFNDPLTQVQGAQVFLTTYGGTTTTNGVYLWGAQLEQGAFPTSYIPTTASTATRTADNPVITGSNFSSWFNPIEGTTVIQLRNFNISATSTSMLSYRGTIVPNNSMNYFRQLDSQPVGQIIFNGTLPMNLGLGAIWTTENLQKHAFFYKKDNSGIANSNLVAVDTSVDIPVVDSLVIGNTSTLQTNNKFTISQITYYPSRLTNTQIQTLTK